MRCPSQDWESYNAMQEHESKSEAAFYTKYRTEILNMATAIVFNRSINPLTTAAGDIVDEAARIVQTVVARGQQ